MNKKNFNPSYKIYKPNFKDNTKGAASSWEWNPSTGNFFLTIAKQSSKKSDSGKPTFSWKEQSETFKFGSSDISEILLVLSKSKPYLGFPDGKKGKGLFHKNSNGNSILKIYQLDSGFGMEISTKKSDVRFWSGHRISDSEAMYLKIILERCVWEMFVTQ